MIWPALAFAASAGPFVSLYPPCTAADREDPAVRNCQSELRKKVWLRIGRGPGDRMFLDVNSIKPQSFNSLIAWVYIPEGEAYVDLSHAHQVVFDCQGKFAFAGEADMTTYAVVPGSLMAKVSAEVCRRGGAALAAYRAKTQSQFRRK